MADWSSQHVFSTRERISITHISSIAQQYNTGQRVSPEYLYPESYSWRQYWRLAYSGRMDEPRYLQQYGCS